MRVLRREARGRADDALNVFDAVTHHALRVVVVVAVAQFVERTARIGQLDAPQHPALGEVVRNVVHRLLRQRRVLLGQGRVNIGDRAVRVRFEKAQRRESAGRRAEPVPTQSLAPLLGRGRGMGRHIYHSSLF